MGGNSHLRHIHPDVKHVPEHIKELIQKSLDGVITADEMKELDGWFYSFSPEELALISEETETAIGRRIKSRLDNYVFFENRAQRGRRRMNWISVAAIVGLISFLSLLFYVISFQIQDHSQVAYTEGPEMVKDVVPGSNKAVLTLADGTTVFLDDNHAGQLSTQGSTRIIKLDDGSVKYMADVTGTAHKKVFYNSVSTPRGGQYQIVLADGSKVWLNSSSYLRFPAVFSGDTREVEITGEAFFEIARQVAKPFVVKVRNMEVQVLGTQFNISAYNDEDVITTTLVKGSLVVKNSRNSREMTPGEQIALNRQDEFHLMPNADTEEAVAWKNGKFIFNNASIYDIMRKVERWYDVDVNFKRDKDLHFTGQLSRHENVSALLRKMELTNEVHFRIEKGKITVLP